MLIKVSYDECLNREKVLRHNPVIHRVKKFDEDSGKEVYESLTKALDLGQPVFPVVIDSYGGQVYGLLSIIQAFRSSPIPVATVIHGKAMSCGAMLAALGTPGYRYMSPCSHILIHHVSSFVSGIVPQIKEDVKHSEYLDRQIFEMVDQHCGHERGFFLDRLKPREGADWYVLPDEAKELNLIDHIKSPSFEVEVRASMRLV
jgi:ATP-dependent protease ClpP protease subunit